MASAHSVIEVSISPAKLPGLLGVPDEPKGLVIFAHGSGSSRFSPRNNHVAAALRDAGIATLLLDLLTPLEESDRKNVFDIDLLASRLLAATQWVREQAELSGLGIGYFGASTGAGAALVAAAQPGNEVAAVVSRGGRPDLAGEMLQDVRAPTLLIVGGADTPVISLNRLALERLTGRKDLVIVRNAGHLFEEPGALDEVIDHARSWFLRYLPRRKVLDDVVFQDRADAGRQLADALASYKEAHPIVLALPRGGVPVAAEIARALEAPLDVILVRKLGAPGHPELGIGAVVDGCDPQLVLNDDVLRMLRLPPGYIQQEQAYQLQVIEQRRRLYRGSRAPLSVKDRTVIVVDDGIATGGTVKAVLSALRRSEPQRLVLAVPVAPAATLDELGALADDVVCLATPDEFYAVSVHYRDFAQTTDEEVLRILGQPAPDETQVRSYPGHGPSQTHPFRR